MPIKELRHKNGPAQTLGMCGTLQTRVIVWIKRVGVDIAQSASRGVVRGHALLYPLAWAALADYDSDACWRNLHGYICVGTA